MDNDFGFRQITPTGLQMKLLFLRHADALPGSPDDLRELSEKGRRQAAEIGRHLVRTGLAVDRVYTSPLVRARDTGREVLAAAGWQVPLEEVGALRNESGGFFEWLRELPEAECLLLVGHMPTVAERVARMIRMSSAGGIHFGKASLACVETVNRRTGTLRFLLAPKWL
jgi:phosphohistidine phosphatase